MMRTPQAALDDLQTVGSVHYRPFVGSAVLAAWNYPESANASLRHGYTLPLRSAKYGPL
ncbi:MAG TPA: hypothetical protein VGS15_04990 [Candidatus Acidoferrales bacterium]|nr:hypothetical protein [Candidatus Acidoferrales bacterium]